MTTFPVRLSLLALLCIGTPSPGAAQSMDALGTRAAGMSGAFVAVVDDASAAYWNPGGFASGAFFSLVIDRSTGEAAPSGEALGASRSAWLIALGAPALGLSYYRLRGAVVVPDLPTAGAVPDRNLSGPADVRVQTLVSHHVGATLVQSVAPGVAVGATLKLVRGLAAAGVRPVSEREALLDDGGALGGRASSRFDADLGLMATFGRVKAGVTVRNLTEPGFDAPDGTRLRLDRQVRAGIAVSPITGWLVATDLDLIETPGPLGLNSRDFALGIEGRPAQRLIVRAGTRFDTADDPRVGRRASGSIGGSYAVTASFLVDGQYTAGSKWAARGWGLAGRFTY